MSVMFSSTCLTVLVLLTGCTADGPVLPKPEKLHSGPVRREREVNQQKLNASALNTALAFEPYRDLATRTTAEPGVQQQEQRNILFSPLGLASALALLSRASESDSRSQALEALGLAADSTEQIIDATISALTDLQHSLTLEEGGGGGGVQMAKTEAGANVDNGTEVKTGTEDGIHAGSRLRVWSGLHIDGKSSLDYNGFLSRTQHVGFSAFNTSFETLMKDLKASDKLELNNYVYFKGSFLLRE